MRFFSRSGCGKFSAVISAGLSAAALLMISGCSVVQVNVLSVLRMMLYALCGLRLRTLRCISF